MKHLDDKIFRPFLHNIQGKCFVTTRSSAQDPIYRSCVTDYEIAIKVIEGAQVSKSEKASSYSKNIKSQLLTNECVSTKTFTLQLPTRRDEYISKKTSYSRHSEKIEEMIHTLTTLLASSGGKEP